VLSASLSSTSILANKPNDEFNLDSKLSYFLPTLSGDGLYSYALIHYLSSIHNDMVKFFIEIKKEPCSYHQSKSVEEFEKEEFIIQFDTQTDLLDLVQSNFTYDSRNLKCLFQYKVIKKQRL
jgi:hypothetical protein